MIKRLFIYTLIMTLFSCAFDSEDDGGDEITRGTSDLRPLPDVDSDGDGIPDDIDPSAEVANIPKMGVLSVSSTSIEIDSYEKNTGKDLLVDAYSRRDTQNFKEIQREELRDRILKLHYLSVQNPNFFPKDDEIINIRDIYVSPISSWVDQNFYSFKSSFLRRRGAYPDAKVFTNFSLYFENLKNVTEIRDVELSIVDYANEESDYTSFRLVNNDGNSEVLKFDGRDGGYISERSYRHLDTSIESRKLKNLLEGRSNLGLRVNDFKYVSHGVELDFSKVLANVNSKSSLFIISTPENFFRYKIIKSGESLKDSFLRFGKDIRVDSYGNVVSFDGVNNALESPFDFDRIQSHHFDKNSLTLINARNLSEISKAGKTYILSIAKSKDVARKHYVGEEILFEHVQNHDEGLSLGRFVPGQLIEIKFTGNETDWYQRSPKSKKIRGTYTCGVPGGGVFSYYKPLTKHLCTKTFNVPVRRVGKRETALPFGNEFIKSVNGGSLEDILLERNRPSVINGKSLKTFRVQVPENRNDFYDLSLDLKDVKVNRLETGFSRSDVRRGCASCTHFSSDPNYKSFERVNTRNIEIEIKILK